MRKILCLTLLLSCLCAMPVRAAQGAVEKPKKSVLCLNSYHHGYQWSDAIMRGIRSVLDNSHYKIDLQIEYMDAKRYNYDDVTHMLLRLYKEKFKHEKFDLIMTSDNDAYSFAMQYRDILFPGVPLVFCGVNFLHTDDTDSDNATGVIEIFDLSKTVDVALRLHPDKKRIVVVDDSSTTGSAIERQVRNQLSRYKKPLTVEYWTDMSLKDVVDRVAILPHDTFLFFIPYYQVIDGRFLTAEEVMQVISTRSHVPIYTAWEFLAGNGAVGGNMLSGYMHGRKAAAVALEILDGKDADDIPVFRETTGEYIFDYAVMKRLKLNMDLLPEGSRIINAPKAFYELSKELFWTIMVSFVLLVLILIFLTVTMLERRKVERKIKDQLAFQETIMDTIPQLVTWKDAEGKFLGTNRSFSEFFGLEHGSGIVHKTTYDVIPDLDYASWASGADKSVIGKGQAFRKKRRKLADAKGNLAWIEVTKVPINDRSGQIVGVLSMVDNITTELNLEKQLLQSQKMEAIGTLAGGIAHDFNNILTSIINSTELAVGDLDPESMTTRDLERVLKAARRGGRVVKQILAFSRPSTEGFRPTDVGGVITEALGLLESSMPRKIEVRSRIAENLSCVYADPTQIHQVVMNLCTNSFHALRRAGGVIEVRLDQAELSREDADMLGLAPGEYVRLVVEDNGPGIPQDIVDKIFDPFFTTKDKTEGTGLGLAVVHGIVHSHKGGLQVAPRDGGGTTFSIYLPKGDEDLCGDVDFSGEPRNLGARILFVEDDVDQLQTTPRLLETMGYFVDGLENPLSAMRLVKEMPGEFDLVITDYDMPGMSGTQLSRRLADIEPDLPVILISGREDAVSAAADLPNIRLVVIKPYDKKDLSRAINTVLNNEAQGE
ncbi:ABC transporter substrate binding protein [Pseudodesulfovibrio thermohalotolerans]|uniref:hybrid sensor histidine kinase/response regulator n=1 Tax=Pseudodesulfovibrio thermohalotolerans TaxID=2880651 RepID=UPI002443418C|nr:ABC transporter substrate binding protein [Pseudodesulfovibrio thermohalotolerans]WFS61420.1 ABC transporter substrate binding protein [Pseudodesulfovibrio thermohalotolerans]